MNQDVKPFLIIIFYFAPFYIVQYENYLKSYLIPIQLSLLIIFFVVAGLIIFFEYNKNNEPIFNIPIIYILPLLVFSLEPYLIAAIVFIYSISIYKKEQIAKQYLIVTATIFIVTILFGLIGFNRSQLFLRDDVQRLTLGFSNPNHVTIYWSAFIISCLYYYFDKLTKLDFLVVDICFICTSLLYYEVTKSRSMWIIVFALLILIVIKFMEHKKLNVPLIVNKIVILLTVITISASVLLVNTKYDAVSSLRFTEWNTYIYKNNLSLFGNQVAIIKSSVDNSIITILFGGGIIAFIVVITGYGLTLEKLIADENILEITILIYFLMYSFLEDVILKPYNFSLIFGIVIFKNMIRKQQKSGDINECMHTRSSIYS